jgi:lipopolysaccharide/colanic/teichoic acid biosynthesis glycosyltransferase
MASHATTNQSERLVYAGPSAAGFDFSDWRALRPAPPIVVSRAAVPPSSVQGWERASAFLLLTCLAPLSLLLAAAIKLESPRGPVFYAQERVGLNRRRRESARAGGHEGPERRRTPQKGRVFRILKFRTMIPDAEGATGPVWASKDDPRVTKVGHLLRCLRLDELPQLLNVVTGDMSLIGPRPERPHFVNRLSEDIPDYVHRLSVPPGITGLAQVEREYDGSVEDVRTKLKYDLFYVRNRCALLDFKILFKTLEIMVRGKGAR